MPVPSEQLYEPVRNCRQCFDKFVVAGGGGDEASAKQQPRPPPAVK